jgi:hypothetical protein
MQPQDPNDEEKLEKEDQDYGTPFSLPDDAAGKIGSDHPSTDDKMDSDELYNEGLSATAGADESDADNSDVTGFTPKSKKPTE